ncbi:MAG: molybdopterin cofactor-binding domain-containing protein, partial [Actinomycetota bacterium]
MLAAADYPALRADQAERRRAGDPRPIGIGLACYNHMTVGGGGEEAAITLLAGGRARVVTGSTDQGHGHALTWAQIASDVTGIDWRHIEVVEGSTAMIGSGVGAVGSRSAQTAGLAVHRSGLRLVAEATELAAALLEAAPGDMVFTTEGGGRFHVRGTPARAVGWAEVAAARAGEGAQELSCGEFYDVEGANSFPSGAHLAVASSTATNRSTRTPPVSVSTT